MDVYLPIAEVSVNAPLLLALGALVGASGKAVGTNLDQGSAYMFVRSGASWSEQTILSAPDGASTSRFGSSVALSGDYASVGTSDFNSNRAYVFARSGTAWPQHAILAASDSVPGDKFGSGVGISGNHILVGDVLKDGLVANQGAVYFFSR